MEKTGRPVLNQNEIPNLDYLRACAVLCVFVHHFTHAVHFGDILIPLGRAGVLLFFVHTSLVLMQSMERIGMRGVPLWAFFMTRRIFRIYPLSIFAVLFMTIFKVPLFLDQEPWHWVGVKGLLSNLALVQNVTHSSFVLGPLWSLPFEVQMYLFLPILFVFVQQNRTRAVLTLTVSAISILCLFVLKESVGLTNMVGLSMLQFFPCFMSGVLAYTAVRTATCRFSSRMWWIFVPAAVLGYYFARLWVDSHRGLGVMSASTLEMICGWLFCALIGFTLPYFRQCEWAPWNRVSHLIAKYSYGIYLSHVPIMWFSFQQMNGASRLAQWGVFAVLTLSVPIISYHALEEPFIRLGTKVAARLFPSRLRKIGLEQLQSQLVASAPPLISAV